MEAMNVFKLLPKELVEQIQEYIEGQTIYIPKQQKKRCKWGEKTDTKSYLKRRDLEIYSSFKEGTSVMELSEKYFLTPKSIQRIIRNTQNV